MDMDDLFPVLAMVSFLAVAVLGVAWHFGRSSSLLEGWARRNGYRIIDKEYRTFFRGPFLWTTGKDQTQ